MYFPMLTGKMQQLSESVVIRSLKRFRDRYFPNRNEVVGDDDATPETEESQPGLLETLPVDLQFLIMNFLSPVDLCRLGATCRYWRAMVRDPVLWSISTFEVLTGKMQQPSESVVIRSLKRFRDRYFPNRNEVVGDNDATPETEESQPGLLDTLPVDLQFLIMNFLSPVDLCRLGATCRYWRAMVRDPVLWSVDFDIHMDSPSNRLATEFKEVLDCLNQQIHGIGSGISYMFNNQHRFNILTLYSTNRADRERARLHQESVGNKLFTFEGEDDSGYPICSPAPQVQQVCQVVDGFIYVANAEPGKSGGMTEVAQIQAALSSTRDSKSRPLLVLSCVSREEVISTSSLQNGAHRNRARNRIPSVDMAKRLGLPQLANPWMVQDTVAESLSGLLDGISWLLRCSGVKL